MAALRSACRHYIFAMCFLSFFLFLFAFPFAFALLSLLLRLSLPPPLLLFLLPRLISALADWMSTVFRHSVVAYSANLECRYEMFCTRLRGNVGPKNHQKFDIWVPLHNFVGLSSQLWYVSADNRKKIAKQQYLPTCPYNMVNVGLL